MDVITMLSWKKRKAGMRFSDTSCEVFFCGRNAREIYVLL